MGSFQKGKGSDGKRRVGKGREGKDIPTGWAVFTITYRLDLDGSGILSLIVTDPFVLL